MAQVLLPDADDLIQIIAAELHAAMSTEYPKKHLENAQRCARILRHSMEQAVNRQFPCGKCGELRTADFCLNCKMTEDLDFDELFPEDEVRE